MARASPSIRTDPPRRSLRRILGTGVERDSGFGSALVNGVHDPLEERQALGRKAQAAPDHDAVVGGLRQLRSQHRDAAVVGGDHAEVAVPAALGHRRLGDVDACVDLVGVEPRRQGRIGEVYGFRLLPNEQYALHDQAPLHRQADIDPASAARAANRNVCEIETYAFRPQARREADVVFMRQV